jgi:hypothetical protein
MCAIPITNYIIQIDYNTNLIKLNNIKINTSYHACVWWWLWTVWNIRTRKTKAHIEWVIAIKWCSIYDLCTSHIILLSENEPLKTEERSKKKLKLLTRKTKVHIEWVIAIKWCSTYDLCTLHVILLSENEPLKTEEGSKKKLKSLTQSKV